MFGLSRLADPSWLLTMALMFLTSMPIHEWAHAWAAYHLGDDTAAQRGRLTINPLAHLDPIGTISLLLVGYGWGKPVPVIPQRLRGNIRTSWALVSAAGPFSNLVLAMLAAIPFRLGWLSLGGGGVINIQSILVQFISINLGLMVFNLIPIPPLDGSRILAWALPRRWAMGLESLERYAGPAMMMALFLLSRLGVLALVTVPFFNFLVKALLFY